MTLIQRIPIEVQFAQGLAGNEQKNRDKTLLLLKKFIRLRIPRLKEPLKEDEFIKLWKGMHYQLWMQDKPLIQEKLIDDVCQLVHDFTNETYALMFIKTFFDTEAREWFGLDQWRMNKFMMFVREFLYHSLMFLKNCKWKESVCQGLSTILEESVMDCKQSNLPIGLKLHLTDIFLTELKKVADDKLTPDIAVLLLSPFLNTLPVVKNDNIMKKLISMLFEASGGNDCLTDRKISHSGSCGFIERDPTKVKSSTLEFNTDLLVERLMEKGSTLKCSSKNRSQIYKLVKRIRYIKVHPQKPIKLLKENEIGANDIEVTPREINAAVKRLAKDKEKSLNKIPTRTEYKRNLILEKKLKKKKEKAEETTAKDDINDADTEEEKDDAESDENVEADSDVDADSDVEADSDVDEDVEADSDVDEDIEADSDVDEDVEADSDVDEDVEADSDVDEDVEADSDVDEDVEADSDVDEDVEADSDVDEDVEADSDVDEDVEVDSDVDEDDTADSGEDVDEDIDEADTVDADSDIDEDANDDDEDHDLDYDAEAAFLKMMSESEEDDDEEETAEDVESSSNNNSLSDGHVEECVAQNKKKSSAGSPKAGSKRKTAGSAESKKNTENLPTKKAKKGKKDLQKMALSVAGEKIADGLSAEKKKPKKKRKMKKKLEESLLDNTFEDASAAESELETGLAVAETDKNLQRPGSKRKAEAIVEETQVQAPKNKKQKKKKTKKVKPPLHGDADEKSSKAKPGKNVSEKGHLFEMVDFPEEEDPNSESSEGINKSKKKNKKTKSKKVKATKVSAELEQFPLPTNAIGSLDLSNLDADDENLPLCGSSKESKTKNQAHSEKKKKRSQVARYFDIVKEEIDSLAKETQSLVAQKSSAAAVVVAKDAENKSNASVAEVKEASGAGETGSVAAAEESGEPKDKPSISEELDKLYEQTPAFLRNAIAKAAKSKKKNKKNKKKPENVTYVIKTPEPSLSPGEKHVSFNMSKNKAFPGGKVTPQPGAFQPSKKPENGILKPSPSPIRISKTFSMDRKLSLLTKQSYPMLFLR